MEKKNVSNDNIDVKPFTVHDVTNIYDDDNIPEVDLPKKDVVIPDNRPHRDGPGGE